MNVNTDNTDDDDDDDDGDYIDNNIADSIDY